MAKQKKKQTKQVEPKKIDLAFSLNIDSKTKIIILAVLFILSAVLPYYYISYAYSVNNVNSFPLDDPWIHLQFAKNLAEYGSFSYFKNEIVTAGSTSPLYTLILAAGFIVTKNEMWLSYILGILFFMVSVYYFYRVADDTFPKENWLALGAVIIFLLDKWTNFIAVTGMETTMYTFLLLAAYYYYRKRNAVLFAVTFGLTFWARPDAIAFIAAIAADYFLLLYIRHKSPKNNEEIPVFTRQDFIKIAAIGSGILAVYFAMNMMISGTLLPNTYGAKIKYYSAEFRSRADFLKVEVWEYFTESAYVLLILPFFIAVIKIFSDTFRLRYNRNTAAAIFIFTLLFIYWYQHPYAHRFGRYLIPLFPFYILLFVYGSRVLFTWLSRYLGDKKLVNGLNIILILVTIAYFGSEYYKNKNTYQEQSRHIYLRQVTAGKWLKENTPEGSVIATHDVGAVAFYSGRKIIDIVGLINPEFIPKLNSKEFVGFAREQMKKQNVTYAVFMREWFQIVNQNPLLEAGDTNFEKMYVYSYSPDKSHILNPDLNAAVDYITQLLSQKQYQPALTALNKVISLDPEVPVFYYLLAYLQSATGDTKSSEENLRKAIGIFPGYRDAVLSLGNLYNRTNRPIEEKEVLSGYLKINPSDTMVAKQLSTMQLKDTIKIK
jgi:hypothetical protein